MGIVEQDFRRIRSGEKVRWEIVGAAPKYEYCIEMAKSSYRSEKARRKSIIEANDERYILSAGVMTIQFCCLPDTIDPRK